MAHKIDLDAANRARTAQLPSAAIEIDWHGTTYRLPVEQPLETARHFGKLADYTDDEDAELGTLGKDGKPVLSMQALDQHYADGLAVLFCSCDQLPWPEDDHPGKPELHDTACQWVQFLRTKPSRETRTELVRQLNAAYYGPDAEPGKSPQRGRSTRSTASRSKQTGGGTGRKTSQRSSGRGAAGTKKAAAKPRA